MLFDKSKHNSAVNLHFTHTYKSHLTFSLQILQVPNKKTIEIKLTDLLEEAQAMLFFSFLSVDSC